MTTTTEIKMRFNLGYLKDEEEIRLESSAIDLFGLCNHFTNILSNASDFGVERIERMTLCGVSDDPMWFCADDEDRTSYEMQMRFTVHHDAPLLSLRCAQDITDAIYANCDNAAYIFVGPYQFKCLTIDDVIEPAAAPNPNEEAPEPEEKKDDEYDEEGEEEEDEEEEEEEEEEECYADIYTPCPPRYASGSQSQTQYNCSSSAFATW